MDLLSPIGRRDRGQKAGPLERANKPPGGRFVSRGAKWSKEIHGDIIDWHVNQAMEIT